MVCAPSGWPARWNCSRAGGERFRYCGPVRVAGTVEPDHEAGGASVPLPDTIGTITDPFSHFEILIV